MPGLFRQFEPRRGEFYVPVENPRRFQHTWVVGKSGVGKSTALINWVVEDISQGDGVAFFDPHGDAIDEVLRFIPRARRNDTIQLDHCDLPNVANALGKPACLTQSTPTGAPIMASPFQTYCEHKGPLLFTAPRFGEILLLPSL